MWYTGALLKTDRSSADVPPTTPLPSAPGQRTNFRVSMSLSNTSKLSAYLGLGLILVACGGPGADHDKPAASDTLAVDTAPKETELISVGGNLFSIPSPVQAALAIRKAGLKYQKDMTAPLDKVDAVAGKVFQSSLLGMYGADMAYVTVHKDGQRAMATMQAIEKLEVNWTCRTPSIDRCWTSSNPTWGARIACCSSVARRSVRPTSI